MAIRKTIGFYTINTPIDNKVFQAATEIEVDKLIYEFILNNKNNIVGWDTIGKGIRSTKTENVK